MGDSVLETLKGFEYTMEKMVQMLEPLSVKVERMDARIHLLEENK